MKPLLIQLDEQTLVALNRVAAPDKRKRSEFVRQAIRRAVRQAEYRAMRDAYRSHAGALPPSRHKEVKPALGYALGWDELIDLGSGASG